MNEVLIIAAFVCCAVDAVWHKSLTAAGLACYFATKVF